jgi:protein CpxP
MKLPPKHAIVVAGILASVALTGCTCGWRSDPQKIAACIVDYVADDLELNSAQIAKLNILKNTVLKSRETMRTSREEQLSSALALLEKPTLDRGRALGLVQQSTHEFYEASPPVIAAFGDFYDSLTPVQQRKAHDIVKNRVERFNRR